MANSLICTTMSQAFDKLIKNVLSNESAEKICRVCLTTDEVDMFSLFSPDDKLCNDDTNLICNRIMLCAKVEIDPSDCFPQFICTRCAFDLETAINFRKRCENSDSVLKKIEVDIKAQYEDNKLIDMCQGADMFAANDFCLPLKIEKETSAPKKFKIKQKSKSYNCKICKKAYKHRGTYIFHKRNAHINENDKPNIYTISGQGRARMFHCVRCNYSSMKDKQMEVHFRTHTGEKPFSCNLCSTAYSQLSTLLRHKRNAHSNERPFSCELCGWTFKLRPSLIRHHMTHVAEFPFKCDVCNKAFKWKHVRDNHLKRHGKEKTMACETCGRLFVLKVDLLNHRLIHKRDTEYSCELCAFKTHVKAYLKRHIWTHTGEARCACEVCGKIFSKRGNLLTHKLVHSEHRSFQCNLCEEKYKQKCFLKKHLASAHSLPKT